MATHTENVGTVKTTITICQTEEKKSNQVPERSFLLIQIIEVKGSHLQLSYALFSMGLPLPSSFCADCYFVLYLFKRLTPK